MRHVVSHVEITEGDPYYPPPETAVIYSYTIPCLYWGTPYLFQYNVTRNPRPTVVDQQQIDLWKAVKDCRGNRSTGPHRILGAHWRLELRYEPGPNNDYIIKFRLRPVHGTKLLTFLDLTTIDLPPLRSVTFIGEGYTNNARWRLLYNGPPLFPKPKPLPAATALALPPPQAALPPPRSFLSRLLGIG